MKKKGLSTVVTSLIIILLVLVAVGIVWIVVKNIISEGAEQVALGKLTMNLEVKSVEVNDGSVDVQVKRNSGAGELSGIKFIVSDGINTQVFEEATTMQELGTRSFTLAYSGLVKEVSIAGIFETESGKEFTGNEIDSFEFSNEEVIKNINGLVSWWRFEGDAQDEMGVNDGTRNGGVNCNADGKYGRACEFDGINDYVDVGTDLNDFSNPFTISLWINPKSTTNYMDFYADYDGSGYLSTDRVIDISYMSTQSIKLHANNGNFDLSAISNSCPLNNWCYVILTFDGTNQIFYINGDFDISNNYTITEIQNSNIRFGGYLGWVPSFNGTIDEVMIFNKALSEDEVKALYEFELS